MKARDTTDGVLLVAKPAGMTSARVVAAVKRVLGGPKVGHLGTLDPFATGLLPLCAGQGTKAAAYLLVADKSYRGVIRLGITTDTDDCSGDVTEEAQVPALPEVDLVALAKQFTGEIEQVPPAFSAIKRGGVPAYKLARRGEAPELEARRVRIDRLHLGVHDHTRLAVEVECSKGTYVRSLARDIGRTLGCGGALESLSRTKVGRFELSEAVTLEELEGEGGAQAARERMIPVVDALDHMRLVEVDGAAATALRQGRQQALVALGRPAEPGEAIRVAWGRDLVAVAEENGGMWRLARVFSA